MSRRLIILIVLAAVIFGTFAFFRFLPSGTAILWEWSGGGQWLLPLIGVSALIDSINPCAFSILLLTIAFLVSIGRLRSGILKIGGAYVLGLFFVYVGIGLGILQALHIFNTPHFMAKVGAGLLVILGAINVLGDFFPSLPRPRLPHAVHHRMATLMDKASMPTAFVLGGLVGLCEFPCTGGPYLMVLGLLHDKTTYLSGLGYLLIYNLIFILPLLVILLMASDRTLLDRVRQWQQKERKGMRLWGGLAMVILGLFIFFF